MLRDPTIALRTVGAMSVALSLLACGPDPVSDAGFDAGFDGGTDAGVDAGTIDAGPCVAEPIPPLDTEELVAGHAFNRPVGLYQAPSDGRTYYVLEQEGRVLLVRDGTVLPTPFLDITDRVRFIGERGLLGLAFHPDYANNGRLFVYYTEGNPPVELPANNLLAEYHRSSDDPDRADSTEVARIVVGMPVRGNHCGGYFAFGPDGFLYGGMGDGASSDQDLPDALDPNKPNGGLVRVDVDAPERGYAPPDNPFTSEGNPQVWAIGLRNPWRWSFDRLTGDMYIGDVGELTYEEINFAPAGAGGGANYGWPAYEGPDLMRSDLTQYVPAHTEPIYAIQRGLDPYLSTPCSVIGGFVYRGADIEGLRGYYLYGDYCSTEIVALRYCDGQIEGHQVVEDLRQDLVGLGSFAQDNRGELYLINTTTGTIRRIIAG